MNYKLLFILCFVSNLIFGQLNIEWETSIGVSNAQQGNTKPRIVLNGAKEPVVVFGKNSGELYLTKMVGNQFSAPQQFASNGMAYVNYWTSADLGSKGDTIYIVFKTLPLETGSIYLVRSFDGGTTLSDTILIDHQQPGVAWLPSLEVDQNGQPHVVYMGHDQNWISPNYYIIHSNDFGASFSNAQNITDGIAVEACDCCPSELVIEANQQVLLYRNNNQNLRDIYGVYSDNAGLDFLSNTNVENLNWLVNSCPSTAPDGVIVDDTLWSVGASKASGSYRVYLSKSHLTSQINSLLSDSLAAPAQVNANQNHPRIAASENYMAIVWHENTGSNYDVYVSVAPTFDGGQLYTTKILANEAVSGNQIYSDVVLDGNEIHIVYQDNSSGTVIYRKGTIIQNNAVENIVEPSFSCWPNPIRDKCSISSTMNMHRVTIFDGASKALQSYELDQPSTEMKLDLSQLMPGKYTIVVDFNFRKGSMEVIKL